MNNVAVVSTGKQVVLLTFDIVIIVHLLGILLLRAVGEEVLTYYDTDDGCKLTL